MMNKWLLLMVFLYSFAFSYDFMGSAHFFRKVDVDSTPLDSNPAFLIGKSVGSNTLKRVPVGIISTVVVDSAKRADDGMVHIRTFSQLQAAVSLYGPSVPCNLSFDSSFTVTSNTVLTANLNIARWLNGCIVRGTNRYLTINKMTADPMFQIADTTGIYLVFGKGDRPHIRYEWWGAKADSSTNCTKAMSTAQTAVYNSGFGTVLLSDGVYKNRGGFDLGGIHNFTIQGSGNSWLYLMDSSNVSMFYSGYGAGHIQGVRNFKCFDVKFNLNYTKQTRVTAGVPWFISTECAIALNYAKNCVAKRCEFWYCPGGIDIINAGYGNERSIINECYFYYCGIGIDSYGYGAQINQNTFEHMLYMADHAKYGMAVILEPVQGDYYVKAHQSNDTMYIDSMKSLIKLSDYFTGKTVTWDPNGTPVTGRRIVRVLSQSVAIMSDTATRTMRELMIRSTIDETIGVDSLWYYSQYFNCDNTVIGNTFRYIAGTPISVIGGSVGTIISNNAIANFGYNGGIVAYQQGIKELKIEHNNIRNANNDTLYAYNNVYGHGIIIADPMSTDVHGNTVEYCNNGLFVNGTGNVGRKTRITVSDNHFNFNLHFGGYFYNIDGGSICDNYCFNNNRSYNRDATVSGIGFDATSKNFSIDNTYTMETDSGQYYSVFAAAGVGFQNITLGRNPAYGTLRGEFAGATGDLAIENAISRRFYSKGSTGDYANSGFKIFNDSTNSDAPTLSVLGSVNDAGQSRAYGRFYRNSYKGQIGTHFYPFGISTEGVYISARPNAPASMVCTTHVANDTVKFRNLSCLLIGDRVLLKGARDSSGTAVDLNTTVRYVDPTTGKIVVLQTAPTVASNSVTTIYEAMAGDMILKNNTSGGGSLTCRTSSTTTADAVWETNYPIRGTATTGQVAKWNSGGYPDWGNADTASNLKMPGSGNIVYVNGTTHKADTLTLKNSFFQADSLKMSDATNDTFFVWKSGKRWEFLPLSNR